MVISRFTVLLELDVDGHHDRIQVEEQEGSSRDGFVINASVLSMDTQLHLPVRVCLLQCLMALVDQKVALV